MQTAATTGTSDQHVTVLLALLNGGRFLSSQLQSLAAQSHTNWTLTVSDDGSVDCGPDQVKEFSKQHPVRMLNGPGQGFAKNFLYLLNTIAPGTEVVALSDQDDVWMPHKLARGLDALNAADTEVPTLYCARYWSCNAKLRRKHLMPSLRYPPSFAGALVQNIACGHTILLNRAAIDLARAASTEPSNVVLHDWWLYQLVTGVGGRVIRDEEPVVLYRQHGGNAIGASQGLPARIKRIRQILQNRYRDWNSSNIDALRASAHRLTPENRLLLEEFARARQTSSWERFHMLQTNGLNCQGRMENVALHVAGLLGKV
jgi:glycosyltransferase involved in cell wall biosynthesis